MSPESTIFHKYITLQSLNLILQIEFEILERYLKVKLKVVQSSTAAEIKRVLNDDTGCHDEART